MRKKFAREPGTPVKRHRAVVSLMRSPLLARWSSPAARRSHKPQVVRSNRTRATNRTPCHRERAPRRPLSAQRVELGREPAVPSRNAGNRVGTERTEPPVRYPLAGGSRFLDRSSRAPRRSPPGQAVGRRAAHCPPRAAGNATAPAPRTGPRRACRSAIWRRSWASCSVPAACSA